MPGSVTRDMPLSIPLLAASAHLLTLAFAYAFSPFTPLFDASPTLLTSHPLLRWDVFHFAHIAKVGYQYEHEWAFFPGLPTILRLLSSSFFTHALILLPLSIHSATTLYQLSLITLRSPSLARLATLLSLLPSSPVTLRLAPYAEPWYTYTSYRGMLHCARKQWFQAALYFTLAASFRSNGITLAGFIVWGLFIRNPSLATFAKSSLLVALVFSPFIYHHISAYTAFCTTHPLTWCTNTFPSIYTHVQAKYWNVGFFNYWSLSQLPNFILAAPILLLIFSFVPSNYPDPALTPHLIHSLFIATTLLFASHTQIALRFAAALPTLYWAAASLFYRQSPFTKPWLWWSWIWGGLSVILWLAFLPPA